MIKDLAIIGAGGFGREVAWLVERINREEKTWNLKGFVDDQQPVGTKVNQYTVIGTTESIKQSKKDLYVVCAVGNAKPEKGSYKVWKTPRQYTLPPSPILP